jgi:uncharacterized protein YbjQ (UPF0145 family)
MTSSAGLPPAGWYPDPADPARQRWWNGAAWTDQTTPSAADAEAGPGATGSTGGGSTGPAGAGQPGLAGAFGGPGSGADPGAGYGGLGPADAGAGQGGYRGAGGYPPGVGGTGAGPAEPTPRPQPAARYDGPPVLVLTTEQAPGYEVRELHGAVAGIVVRPRSAFAAAGATFLPGTEASGYAALLQECRREAVDALRAACHDAGGNAVLGTRVSSSEIADYLFQTTAEGTAVTVDPAP